MKTLDGIMHVFYCPELNQMGISKLSDGYVFKNEYGRFHMCTHWTEHKFKQYKFYVIGKL